MKRIRTSLALDKKCPEHGVIGTLPRPWPNCPNGIDTDEFEEHPIIDGIETDQWKRQEWKSPLGGFYYTWRSRKLPNWFQAPQTFWNEARRLKLVQNSYPNIVYQYTSLEGFMGIIKSRSLWLTEFEYLNDRREVHYGLDVILDAINKLMLEATRNDERNLLEVWKTKLQGKRNRVCIASFSGESDSLSQWRAYGPIAIGFPVHSLSLHVDQSRLQPVIYSPEIQEKLSQVYVQHLVASFRADMDAGMLENLEDVYHESDRLTELGVFFKDHAFYSEDEYRLAYIDYPAVLASFGISSPPRSFRVAGGRIIPYVPSTDVLPSEHRDFPLEISDVVLGPESDELLEQGIREFVNENGLQKVTVRRSRVPLRP